MSRSLTNKLFLAQRAARSSAPRAVVQRHEVVRTGSKRNSRQVKYRAVGCRRTNAGWLKITLQLLGIARKGGVEELTNRPHVIIHFRG